MHPGPGHLFSVGGSDTQSQDLMATMVASDMLDNADGHQMDLAEASKRFWLYLTRLDQVFDSIVFDAEYFGTSMAGTMDLHQVGGSLVLFPAALIAAYVAGEYDGDEQQNWFEDLVDLRFSHATTILLIAMAVAHLLRPMSLSRFVIGSSETSYTLMRMMAVVLTIVWAQMYMSPPPASPSLMTPENSLTMMELLGILGMGCSFAPSR